MNGFRIVVANLEGRIVADCRYDGEAIRWSGADMAFGWEAVEMSRMIMQTGWVLDGKTDGRSAVVPSGEGAA